MIRRLALVALLLVAIGGPLAAQMPLIVAPQGDLRINLSGSLYPNEELWIDGRRQPLGSIFETPSNPLITSLQQSLAQALGHPVTGRSLGAISAVAAREHGVGDVGLAYGLTPRITIFTNVPIVYVRSRVATTFNPATAQVGLNPAVIGDDASKAQSATFFAQFKDALMALTTRLQNGDYASDPAALALAQQTLSSATAMRTALLALSASPVVPVATDAIGTELLAQVTGLQTKLSGPLGVAGFNTAPVLAAATLTSDDFDKLLSSAAGLGFSSPNNLPHYGLGDITAGLAVQLGRRGAPGDRSWLATWLRATVRFPSATEADPTILLNQPTGDRRPALQLDGIAELGKNRLGIRGELSYLHQLASNSQQRITSPDQPLVPASYLAAVRTQPGDSVAFTARPFLRFAPHMALTATLQYWWKAANHTAYYAGQLPVGGLDASLLDIGSAANAAVVGIGFSYVHDGCGRDGSVGAPVEASWSLERTIFTGQGIFPVTLTSRMSLRIYRPIVKH